MAFEDVCHQTRGLPTFVPGELLELRMTRDRSRAPEFLDPRHERSCRFGGRRRSDARAGAIEQLTRRRSLGTDAENRTSCAKIFIQLRRIPALLAAVIPIEEQQCGRPTLQRERLAMWYGFGDVDVLPDARGLRSANHWREIVSCQLDAKCGRCDRTRAMERRDEIGRASCRERV